MTTRTQLTRQTQHAEPVCTVNFFQIVSFNTAPIGGTYGPSKGFGDVMGLGSRKSLDFWGADGGKICRRNLQSPMTWEVIHVYFLLHFLMLNMDKDERSLISLATAGKMFRPMKKIVGQKPFRGCYIHQLGRDNADNSDMHELGCCTSGFSYLHPIRPTPVVSQQYLERFSIAIKPPPEHWKHVRTNKKGVSRFQNSHRLPCFCKQLSYLATRLAT